MHEKMFNMGMHAGACAHTLSHLFHKNFGCREVRTHVCARLIKLIKENPEQPLSDPQGIFSELKTTKVSDLITSGSTCS